MPDVSVADLVVTGEAGEEHLDEGAALCMSGGGYRAMLFHAGVLWRLNELGLLVTLKRVSSVSGGSITAAQLGLTWQRLEFTEGGVATNLEESVVRPLRQMATTTVDVSAAVSGLLLPGTTIGARVAGAYRDRLFGSATLQDLPDDDEGPRFVINATNLQSGALWRFSRPYMADYRVGLVENPTVPLADAVAASSAFPPFLSPFVLEVDPTRYTPESRTWELHREPFTNRVVLSDGGVYDNLGLETAWKNHRTVLASDGGGWFQPRSRVARTWGRQMLRVLRVVDGQVRALRRQQVVGSYQAGERHGAFVGIATPVAEYPVRDPLPCPPELTASLAAERTRLKSLPTARQAQLVNWGYVAADASIRSYHLREADPPSGLPYPDHPLV